MKKNNTTPATAAKAETKSANTNAAKAAPAKAAKTEKAAEPKAEKAPKTVELPDPAKMTKEDYKKVSRKMRRLRREGRKDEAAQLETIVAAAKKNLGIGAKAEKAAEQKAEKAPKAEKAEPAKAVAKAAPKAETNKKSTKKN